MRAIFLGSDSFSLPVMQALLEHGPSLSVPVTTVGVVTQPDRPEGRGRRLRPNPVKSSAQAMSIPVLQPGRIRDQQHVDEVLALLPDLLIVASFGQILPRRLVEAPRYGALNLHPSLLPLYRGPAPIAGPILHGDSETGTTLMLMVTRMDAGPILAQRKVAIEPEEPASSLRARLAAMSGHLLVEMLPAWLQGDLDPVPQDESLATYTQLITKADGRIDWTTPAVDIARRVRAYDPWPGTYGFWEDRTVRVIRARPTGGKASPGAVVGLAETSLLVGTGGGILAIDEMQLAGGKPLSAPVVVRGHPGLLTATLR